MIHAPGQYLYIDISYSALFTF